MNEPIISPWLFFFAEMGDDINFVTGFVFILCVCVVGFLSFIVGIKIGTDDWDGLVNWFKTIKFLLVALIVSGIIGVLVPNRDTVIAMIVADNVTPANLESGKREAKELIDYVFEKIDQKDAQK